MRIYKPSRFFVMISAMIALMSCNYNQVVDVTDSVVTVDTLVFADTVGILMGDSNYVFGTLSTVRVIPEGIVVLDGIACRVSLFDLSGEFITSQGRQGEAPGEYSQPWAICRLQGGEYFIFDHGAQKMTLLDSSLNYLSSINATLRVPLKLAAGADSMVVIKEIVTRFENEQLLAGYRIYSLNVFSGQEGYVYRDCQLPMGAPQVDLKSEFCFFTTDVPGNVYIADYDSDEYSIEILSPEGELQRVIDMGSSPRDDFDIEIHALNKLPIRIPLTTEAGTSDLLISAPEKHPYVTDLAIDGENNIWVRRSGVQNSETWDVVSLEGELLRQVVLLSDTSGSGYYPSLHVSPSGLVATFGVENDYERFFIVEPLRN